MGAVDSKQWSECYKTKQNIEQFFFPFFSFPLQGWRGIHSGVQIKPNCERNSIKKTIVFLKKR